jgi:hypothetical protein
MGDFAVLWHAADSANLRIKLLPQSCRILIEQRLNPIPVLLKQRPDLLRRTVLRVLGVTAAEYASRFKSTLARGAVS